ncbi:MAG: AbrB/MazE/SpoVT family DNA-binding domain-containing protein [Proteobacteria bacterium]|nr:AbrB/MazE/SpoVT family DNA-binding domain-containing protein [Pseudomonadota bacterium]
MKAAKVFKSGNSQAVRLPKEFRPIFSVCYFPFWEIKSLLQESA